MGAEGLQLTSIDVIASAIEPVAPTLGRLSSPDGAVTLMLSDIAQAGALAEQLGTQPWEQLVRDHNVLVEQLVSHHDGEIVRFQDDGFFASFNSAHAGVHAAIELQRAFADTAVPAEGKRLALRIGLHSGFVLGNPEHLMGRNVVLAARIAAHAKGGEILVSSPLKQYTETDLTLRFEARGEHYFKGVHGEHELFAVAWR